MIIIFIWKQNIFEMIEIFIDFISSIEIKTLWSSGDLTIKIQ